MVDLEKLQRCVNSFPDEVWDFGPAASDVCSYLWIKTGHAPGDPEAPDTRFGEAISARAALIVAMFNAMPTIIGELTSLRAKVAAGERLRDGVAFVADDYGSDSEMVEFADDIRGHVAEYDAAVKP